MVDPVTCEDGYTYERSAIISLPNNLSPITRQPMDKSILFPNLILKKIIDLYVEKHNIELSQGSSIITKQIPIRFKRQSGMTREVSRMTREVSGMTRVFNKTDTSTLSYSLLKKRFL